MHLLKRAVALCVGLAVLTGGFGSALAQEVGKPWTGEVGITETVDEIMARQNARYPGLLGRVIRNMEAPPLRPERELEILRRRRPNRDALEANAYPNHLPPSPSFLQKGRTPTPYTIGTNFLGIEAFEAQAIPPDSMGDVGPTQVLVATNGRLKVFDRNGNVGPLNVDLDVFFNSVRNGAFTTDPQVRYDRLTQRWIVMCINIPLSGLNVLPNRVLIAVSSGSSISGAGSFSFYFFDQELVGGTPNPDSGEWLDYPSLGVDNNALYIAGNLFNQPGTQYGNSTLFVVRKSSVTGGGPIVVTAFRNLVGASGGPVTPRGVDNDDPASTQGYLIAADAAVFSKLVLRRISDPGGTPTISGDIGLTVPLTTFPQNTPCLGSATPLDGLDDRIFQAKILFNKLNGTRTLWTSHNMEVNASGVASSTGNRNGSRWYEIANLAGTPSLVQAGTVFSNAASNPDNFWIPSLAMNLQGHAMLGCSVAGPARRAEVVGTTRFASDALGSMRPPETAQTSATNYNVEPGVQRWGDYSATVVDPNDGMSVWTFQEYCNATNSWGVRVFKLLAPPPATIQSVSQTNLVQGSNPVVTVTGTSVNGSGFFDPGAGYLNHISALVSGAGVTVNSVAFNSPTSVTLNLSVSAGAALGSRNLTITNPDGQSTILNGAFTVVAPAAQIVNPSSYAVLTGSETSHNLAAFFTSDDVRQMVQADSSQGFVSLLEFVGTSPFASVTRISYILESSTNFSDRRRMIQMFNYTNSQWELLSTTAIPLVDGTVQVNVTTNPSRFVNPSTGEVKARVLCDFPTASRDMARSFEFFDRAVWEVVQ